MKHINNKGNKMITQKNIRETIAKLKKYQGNKTGQEMADEIGIPYPYYSDMIRHGVMRDGKYQSLVLMYVNKRELAEQL
jgi:hypothetical protein